MLVFMDESYIHTIHFDKNGFYWSGPFGESNRTASKGRRLVIIRIIRCPEMIDNFQQTLNKRSMINTGIFKGIHEVHNKQKIDPAITKPLALYQSRQYPA